MEDPGSGQPPSDREVYEEARRKHLHTRHLLGLAVWILLWLLSAVPLARSESTAVTAAWLAVGLGIAVVIRGFYAWRTGRPILSPWLFAIAAVLAIVSYVVQGGG